MVRVRQSGHEVCRSCACACPRASVDEEGRERALYGAKDCADGERIGIVEFVGVDVERVEKVESLLAKLETSAATAHSRWIAEKNRLDELSTRLFSSEQLTEHIIGDLSAMEEQQQLVYTDLQALRDDLSEFEQMSSGPESPRCTSPFLV